MKIEIQDLFNDWEENEVQLPEEQTNVKAICSKTMEKISATPKKRHPLRTVLIAAAAAVLLCGSALAVPAVREAVGEVLGMKTDRGSNAGYVTIDGVTQNMKHYSVQLVITPAEDALTRFETVYRPTYLPDGYIEDSGHVGAVLSENRDLPYEYTQAHFGYLGREIDYENDDITVILTAPTIQFDQLLAVDCVENPDIMSEYFSDIEAPETRTVTLGGVECQCVSGSEIMQFENSTERVERKVVYWSDGNYVFILRTLNADLSDKELGRIIASVEPLEDCSPYLRIFNADWDVEHDAIKTVYMPTSMPKGQKYVGGVAEDENGRLMSRWSIQNSEGDFIACLDLTQFTYKDAYVLEIMQRPEEETRIINSTEVTFTREIRHQEGGNAEIVSAAWETDGYYFTAVMDGTHVEVDELAEIIASIEPNEELCVNTGVPIEKFYAPSSVPADWEMAICDMAVDSSSWCVGYNIPQENTDDCYGYCFLNQTTYNLCPLNIRELLLDETTESREINSHNVSFYLDEKEAFAAWQADGYYFLLTINYGDSGHERTIDEIAEIVASMEPVESEWARTMSCRPEESIETYYLPKLSDEWDLVSGRNDRDYEPVSSFHWMSEDYASVYFTQRCQRYPETSHIIDHDPGAEYRNVSSLGELGFYTNNGHTLVTWAQDGYTMELLCTDGDTTKWTVDDVAALVESVHSVEDITPYLIGE